MLKTISKKFRENVKNYILENYGLGVDEQELETIDEIKNDVKTRIDLYRGNDESKIAFHLSTLQVFSEIVGGLSVDLLPVDEMDLYDVFACWYEEDRKIAIDRMKHCDAFQFFIYQLSKILLK